MAYSALADVQRLIKWFVFTSTSVPLNTADVAALISEADAEINGMIGQLYTIPVTNATDIAILQYASLRMAAYAAAKILISQAGGDLPQAVQDWQTEAETRIARLQNRELVLENTGMRTVSKGAGLYSHTANHPDAPARVWQLEKDQW